MNEIVIIGLSTIALLSMWNSYILSYIVSYLQAAALRSGCAPLTYLLDCDYCKGFWLCVIGAAIAGEMWYMFPAYGLVVIGLGVQDAGD